MSLADVKHQAAAQQLLQAAFLRNRLPHAFVFHGPDGVGKEMLARGLGQLLLCPFAAEFDVPEVDRRTVGLDRLQGGCSRCDDCRLVRAETHPDLHIVYRQLHRHHPESDVRKRKGLELSVDVVRHFVIDKAGLTPARGRAKVFIIREADRMSDKAQNALLKTLEEPPLTTYLILVATALDRLLATTMSRCQWVPFGTLPATFLMDSLRTVRSDLSPDQIDWYARNADGSPGKAFADVDDQLFDRYGRVLRQLARLAHGDSSAVAKALFEEGKSLGERLADKDPEITEAEATRGGLKKVLVLFASAHRELLHRQLGRPMGAADSTLESLLPKDGLSAKEAENCHRIRRIVEAENQLDRNVHPQLCMDALAASLVEPTPSGDS